MKSQTDFPRGYNPRFALSMSMFKTTAATISGLMAFAAVGVHAQSIASIGSLQNENDGDLVLFFSNTITPPLLGSTPQELVVDLGPASDYYSTANALAHENTAVSGGLTPGTRYTVKAYDPVDLASVFGANANSENTRWAAVGGNGEAGGPGTEPVKTLWLSSSGAAFAANDEGGQSEVSIDIDGATNVISGTGLASPVAVERPQTTGSSFTNMLGAFGTLGYSDVVVNSTTSNLAAGGASTLELYELLPTDGNTTGGPSVVDLGSFSLTNAGLTFTAFSAAAILPPSGGGRIENLSARANVGTGGNILIAGFVVRGTGSKSVLLRGIGPTLGTEFNVSGALSTPQLTLMSSAGTPLASNAGWGGGQRLTNAFVQTGAFLLSAGSLDSAILTDLPVGSYTSQMAGADAATGVALAEIYDADPGTSASSLINISARANIGSGADILIAGFVIGGSEPAQLLLRGVGPTLNSFGVSGPIEQPSIGLYDSKGVLMASDSGWGNPLGSGPSPVASAIRQATPDDMGAVGAFALPNGSADCAIVVTLLPGSYTVQMSGNNGAAGIGLLEVYLMP